MTKMKPIFHITTALENLPMIAHYISKGNPRQTLLVGTEVGISRGDRTAHLPSKGFLSKQSGYVRA